MFKAHILLILYNMAEFANIETRLFINGEFTPSIQGKIFKLINPATDKLTAEIYEGGAEDVDLAVQSAKNAFPAWAQAEGIPLSYHSFGI